MRKLRVALIACWALAGCSHHSAGGPSSSPVTAGSLKGASGDSAKHHLPVANAVHIPAPHRPSSGLIGSWPEHPILERDRELPGTPARAPKAASPVAPLHLGGSKNHRW